MDVMEVANPITRPEVVSEKGQLAQFVREGTLVSVYLVSGIHLKGHLLGFDNYTLLFKGAHVKNSHLQLIYKHAISTIVSAALADGPPV